MKRLVLIAAVILTMGSATLAQDPGWPRQKKNSSGTLIYYQPQVDDWINYRQIDFRMAFKFTPTGGKAVVGVITISANTDVNVNERTVTLSNPIVTNTAFPSLDTATSSQMDLAVRTFVPPDMTVTVSLDRVVASVNKSKTAPAVAVQNNPPLIFTSNRPAIVVQVDGQPVTGKIKDTKLEFVVNTNWPIFLDTSNSVYYLFTGKQWLMSTGLNGPWSITGKLPKDMSKVAKDPQWSGLASSISPVAFTSGSPPAVFYCNSPGEAIVFQGQPVYSQIPGTQLVYASNTDADLFVYSPTQTYYFLTAGRWFSSGNLQGPWTYATPALPKDFSRIPPSTSAGRVLVSVPGTDQAKDAVLLAQIPTMLTVDPKAAAAQVNVVFDGQPSFSPIEGTSLSYATNTVDKVIQDGDVYYLCLQGIWFMSAFPQGPWTTATVVPSEIYTIPPSSPLYNVTYVTQSVASDGYIEASYTAGYFGSFVLGAAVGAVIACGSGYYYPPYFYYGGLYPVYRPWPATYGVGSFYNSYTGAYGVARGVYGPYGGATGWASYNPYTGTYARGASAYGPYGSASAARAYNPYTGTYARGASVSTAYGTRSAAGAYNPYTGVGAATRQGSTPYGQWGSSVVSNGNRTLTTQSVSNSRGTIGAAQSSSGGTAVAGSGAYGSGGAVKTAGGDMYAGRDGNVYKNTGSGWQSYNNGGWNNVNTPRAQGDGGSQQRSQMDSGDVQNLGQEMQNRQRGAAQDRSFQGFNRDGGGFSRGGGFGGGGFGGGGFGGRRR